MKKIQKEIKKMVAKTLIKKLDFPKEFRERVSTNLKECKTEHEQEQKAYNNLAGETLTEIKKIENEGQDYTVIEVLERVAGRRLDLFKLYGSSGKSELGGGKNITYSLVETTNKDKVTPKVKGNWMGLGLEDLREIDIEHLKDYYYNEGLLNKFLSELKKVNLVEIITRHYVYRKK